MDKHTYLILLLNSKFWNQNPDSPFLLICPYLIILTYPHSPTFHSSLAPLSDQGIYTPEKHDITHYSFREMSWYCEAFLKQLSSTNFEIQLKIKQDIKNHFNNLQVKKKAVEKEIHQYWIIPLYNYF